jgi:hypothetical protein
MQLTDERQITRRMDELAAEYSRTHDEKIKAEIFALAGRLVELKKRESLH